MTMCGEVPKSPCRTCDLVDQDKDNSRCVQCQPRLDYIQGMNPAYAPESGKCRRCGRVTASAVLCRACYTQSEINPNDFYRKATPAQITATCIQMYFDHGAQPKAINIATKIPFRIIKGILAEESRRSGRRLRYHNYTPAERQKIHSALLANPSNVELAKELGIPVSTIHTMRFKMRRDNER